MKRIKSIHGYTIYEATSARDEANHNCQIGSYNIYLSSDIRDYGLSYSTPEWDDIDSLATAIAMCSGSQWATACALAEEISGSTAQDMDLALEIERRLDAGEALSDVRADLRKVYLDEDDDELDEDELDLSDDLDEDDLDGDLEDILDAALSAGDRADQNLDYDHEETDLLCRAMAAAGYSYDGIDSHDGYLVFNGDWCTTMTFESWPGVRAWLEGVVFDDPEVSDAVERVLHPEHFEQRVDPADLQDYLDRNYEDPDEVFSCSIDEELRQMLISGETPEYMLPGIEGGNYRGMAVLELGYADIEVNLGYDYDDKLFADYFVCLKDSSGDWESDDYTGGLVSIDWSAPNWQDLLRQEMRHELRSYARKRGWDISRPMDEVMYGAPAPAPEEDHTWLDSVVDQYVADCKAPEEETPARRSHASYYVIEHDDRTYSTCTEDHLVDETPEEYKRFFFRRVANRIAFSDCSYDHVDEIVFDGERVHYAGWQPGMLIEFISDSTGEIVFSESFPQWDH